MESCQNVQLFHSKDLQEYELGLGSPEDGQQGEEYVRCEGNFLTSLVKYYDIDKSDCHRNQTPQSTRLTLPSTAFSLSQMPLRDAKKKKEAAARFNLKHFLTSIS